MSWSRVVIVSSVVAVVIQAYPAPAQESPDSEGARRISVVVATLLGDEGASESPVRLEIRAADRSRPSVVEDCLIGTACTVSLPTTSKMVFVTALAEGFWKEEHFLQLEAVDTKTPSRITLRREGSVTGRLSVEAGVLPDSLVVTATPAETTDPAENVSDRGTLQVQAGVDRHGRISTTLPVGRYDLKLRVTGYASVFAWNRRVASDSPLDLGSLALKPGASVIGWIESSNPEAGLADVTVRLSPIGGREFDRSAAHQRETATVRATTNESGFFAFQGLRPGSYTLAARSKDGTSATFSPVNVYEGSESEIRHPLLLQPPAVLEVALSPPFDGGGEDWTVELLAATADPGYLRPVDRQMAEQGLVAFEGLQRGTYQILVESVSGDERLARWLEVQGTREHVQIDTTGVPVWGSVTLGDEPLECELWFGGTHGEERILLPTATDGTFEGSLSRAGRWHVEIRAEDEGVTAPRVLEVPTRMGETGLEIDLPDRGVRGVVQEADGAVVADARVSVVSAEGSISVAVVRTGSKGTFRARGLEGGSVFLKATSRGEESESVEVPVADSVDESPEHVLVLRDARDIAGRVVGPGGGVFGCVVELSSATDPMTSATAVTDFEGRFTARLPGNVDDLRAVLLPPGLTLDARTTAAPDEGELVFDVAQTGGRVEVDLSSLLENPEGRVPFLVHDRVPITLNAVHKWTAIEGSQPWSGAESSFVIVQAGVGEWALCISAVETLVSAFVSPQQCVSGMLAPHGVLRLSADHVN